MSREQTHISSPQPPQHQDRQPGIESETAPRLRAEDREYRGSGKLRGKVGLITGGDSGIGRAVAIAFAKEGADVAIAYLNEHGDAQETRALVEKEGRRCVAIAGDVGDEGFCQRVVQDTVGTLGRRDILVNHAAEQHPQESLEQITSEQIERTFRTSIFSYFYMMKAALSPLRDGSAVINTTSMTAYRGSPHLLDYSATKGAIVAVTCSVARALVGRGIHANGVAPGSIWTPLIPATFPAKRVATFGADVPMQRAGQPEEVAPSYVFLASDDASYMAGQILHPNGGEVVNG
jgi:NAD(P)-dependent dehydrogenase (short-subunit alcohol dehydrogenase family)